MHPLMVPVADLLLGARCAGCGGAAATLCPGCRAAVRPDPQVRWPRPVPAGLTTPTRVFPVAAGPNSGTLQRVVVSWKESGVTRLTDVLDHLLAAAVVPHLRPGCATLLVPVPTSAAGRRARGGDLVEELARSSARLLRRTGADVTLARALTHARPTADQSGLGAAARRVNLEGAFRLRSERGLDGRDLVVVDDILTTGATVTEAVRVLSAAGHRPVGVAVVAATPLLSETNR